MVNAIQPRSHRQVVDQPRGADDGGRNQPRFPLRMSHGFERFGVDQDEIIDPRKTCIPEQINRLVDRRTLRITAADRVAGLLQRSREGRRPLPLVGGQQRVAQSAKTGNSADNEEEAQ